MNKIYQIQKTQNNLIINVIYFVYNQAVYRIEKTKKGGETLRVRTAKILDSVKDWPNLESKLTLVGDTILSEPMYFKASDSLDIVSCETGKFHISFCPSPELILSVKLFYLKQISKNVL